MKLLAKNAQTCLFILVFTLLVGCREVYTFDTAIVNNQLNFSINEFSEVKDKHLMLYDISVVKQNCKSDCTIWELVREQNKLEMSNDNYLSFPIEYGKAIKNTQETVAPKPVGSGEYVLSATIAVIDKEKIEFSRLVHGNFKVEKSEDGKMTLVK